MIRNFGCRQTERFFRGQFVKTFSGIERPAYKRLKLLDNAESLEELAAFPGNQLEKLAGNRKGQYSIRINKQWRICFKWDDSPYEVEIVDYH